MSWDSSMCEGRCSPASEFQPRYGVLTCRGGGPVEQDKLAAGCAGQWAAPRCWHRLEPAVDLQLSCPAAACTHPVLSGCSSDVGSPSNPFLATPHALAPLQTSGCTPPSMPTPRRGPATRAGRAKGRCSWMAAAAGCCSSAAPTCRVGAARCAGRRGLWLCPVLARVGRHPVCRSEA